MTIGQLADWGITKDQKTEIRSFN